MQTMTLYTYHPNQLKLYTKQQKEKGISIISFSQILSKEDIMELIEDYEDEELEIDITTLVEHLDYYRERIFMFESLFKYFPEENEYIFLVNEKVLEKALKIFKFNFNTSEPIRLENYVKEEISGVENDDVKKKITELSDEDLESFSSYFNNNLVGHEQFKAELYTELKSFQLFNRLGEQPVLSIFLLGNSGLGKTEVARLFHQYLDTDSPLAKINFGNYSDEHSMSSLIGSPRGYKGSESGELIIKIEGSNTGVLLIDEFEKGNKVIFNAFLQLLEEGKIDDSLGRTHNLNGYVLIFSSNISEADFEEKIPEELKSRFDLVFKFVSLSENEKKKYIEKKVNSLLNKIETEGIKVNKGYEKIIITKDLIEQNNLREINQIIRRRLVELVKG